MEKTISEIQWKIFQSLLQSADDVYIPQIIAKTGLDHPVVTATLLYGQEQGWVQVHEEIREELIPSENAREQMGSGLPERWILAVLEPKGKAGMREIAQLAQQQNIPMNEIIKWGGLRNWIEKDQGELALTENGRQAIKKQADDEKALLIALKSGSIFLDELESQGIDPEQVKKLLSHRSGLAKIKSRTNRRARITEQGRTELTQGIRVIQEKNILSSDDIISGEWKNIKLRQYDVSLQTEKVYPAKIHLMQKIIQQTRSTFLEMGFTEIVSPQVESAFWDFDALFQPQDHPARDAQDTFYMKRPKTARLPEKKIVERVKATHENGGDTGSTGWGYKWDQNRAQQVVLRTHTTATTIRALAEDPNPPRKVFCVGKVYRNESISYKHLPEFFQVDGVVIDEDASLVTLLGTLKEFYRKMGFEKVKFKPAFFPYTEPSAEAFVYMESKKSWIEMGGSGVFRPEVTRPFGCRVPVLAWGLGLDRLAMLRYGINDIRELYWSDLDRIREVSLCR